MHMFPTRLYIKYHITLFSSKVKSPGNFNCRASSSIHSQRPFLIRNIKWTRSVNSTQFLFRLNTKWQILPPSVTKLPVVSKTLQLCLNILCIIRLSYKKPIVAILHHYVCFHDNCWYCGWCWLSWFDVPPKFVDIPYWFLNSDFVRILPIFSIVPLALHVSASEG